MKIVDLVEEEPALKKQIELLYCLMDDIKPTFGGGDYNTSLPFFEIVERVALKVWNNLDLITLTRKDESKCFFLGHWNDGVALENNIVIDNFAEVKSKVPIELVSCLQVIKNGEGHFYFYESEDGYNSSIKRYESLTRLARNINKMDLILAETESGGNATFLGHWNDGVI